MKTRMEQGIGRRNGSKLKAPSESQSVASYGSRIAKAVRPKLAQYLALAIAMLSATLFTGINIFKFPHYEVDEGTYVSSAWAMFEKGNLSYYTYNYDHPILGWVQIGMWAKLVGGFLTFDFSVNTGRTFMLLIAVLSTAMIFMIVQRTTGRTAAALLAALVFAGSPLGVSLHRQVWLDNIATFWLLVSIYMLLTARGNLARMVVSALAFGLAIWSKEVYALFLPGMLYLVYTHAHLAHRRFSFSLWGVTAVSVASLFGLQAFLKDELLPPGFLWSSPKPHVSLVETLVFQASRGSAVPPGPFDEYFKLWASMDPILIIGGLVTAVAGLLFWRRGGKASVGMLILVVIYLAFNARGGVVLFHYVIPLLALLAVSIGLFAGYLANVLPRWRFSGQTFAAVALALAVALSFQQAQANAENFKADSTSVQVEAAQWVAKNLPDNSVIIMDSYPWVDLRDPSFTGGGVFSNAHYYYPAQLDPEIRKDFLHNNWRNIDYLLLSQSTADNIAAGNPDPLPLIQGALKNSKEIRTFKNNNYSMQVFEVGKSGSRFSSKEASAKKQAPAPSKDSSPAKKVPERTSETREEASSAQRPDSGSNSKTDGAKASSSKEGDSECKGTDVECLQRLVTETVPRAEYVGGRVDTNAGGNGRNRNILYFINPDMEPCEYKRLKGAADGATEYVAIIVGSGSFGRSDGQGSCVPGF